MAEGPGAEPGGGELGPAFYAPAVSPSRARQWWSVLHPPYTAWHLAYVVIGACLAPKVALVPLLATLGAFALAVGVAAHALDELHGRPLRTTIPRSHLLGATLAGVAGAVVLGALGVVREGVVLVPFIVLGAALVVAYSAELFGGLVHTDWGFALAWGAFPVLVGYVAQAERLSAAAVLAAAGAVALSVAQRALSTEARRLRRRVASVEGVVRFPDGSTRALDRSVLLAPLETALRALAWGMVGLAAGLAVARLR